MVRGGYGRETEDPMEPLAANVVGRIVRLVAQQGSYIAVVQCALVCKMWRDEVAKAMREPPLRALRASFWAFHGTAKLRFEVPYVACANQSLEWIRWLPGRRFFMTENRFEGTVWSVGVEDGRVPAIANRFRFFEDKEMESISVAGDTGDILVSSWPGACGFVEMRLYSSRSGWRDARRPALVSQTHMHTDQHNGVQFSVHAIDISPDGQKVVVAAVSGRPPASILTVTLLDRDLEPLCEKVVSLPDWSWEAPGMVAVLDPRAELLVVVLRDIDLIDLFAFELTGGPWGDVRPEIYDITDRVFPDGPQYSDEPDIHNPKTMDAMTRLSSGHPSWEIWGERINASSSEPPPVFFLLKLWRHWLQGFAVGLDKSGLGVATTWDGIHMLGWDDDRPSAIKTLEPEEGPPLEYPEPQVVDLSGNWLVATCGGGIRGYEMWPDYSKLAHLLQLNRSRGIVLS